MRPRTSKPVGRLLARLSAACALVLAVNASFASAATYYVDGANPGATDSGPGTSAQPYRTVQAAVTAFGVAGNTIVVRPAVYREQVSVAASGTSSSPIVLEAAGSGVVVSGSDDLSGTAKWSAFSGSVFVASSVTWAPLQVFANGARLTPSTAPPASLPANSFVHVSGSGLYVNLGGPNPGGRSLEVGRRANGFRVTGSYVTVNGFQVMNAESDGIEVSSATGSTIRNCRVSFANQQGIHVGGSTSVLVLRNVVSDNNDHGIYVTTGTGCRVAENESFLNARPGVRAANGIYVNGSTSCMVESNRCHDNQDSGLQFYNGANNSTSRNNVSWNNGDHGFDHVRTSGVRHSNDVAYGNYRDGFSFEGDSPGASFFNCIAVDNGLATNEFDLWVDATSMSGFQSNDNIVWKSTGQAVAKYGSTPYTSLAAFAAASGTDSRSLQTNPLFMNPAAGTFTLSPGSPAIDNANAGAPAWPGRDATGVLPLDDPSTTNTGLGSPSFADRGAHEFTPAPAVDHAPVVTVAATATVNEGVVLTIAVSVADSDGDPIASLTANLSGLPAGHNAVFVANASKTAGTLTWTPSYGDGRPAPYTVAFTAANALSGTAGTAITVVNVDRAPVVSAPASGTAAPSTLFTLNVTAADPDGDAIGSLTADLTGLPSGHDAVFTANASRTAGTLTWTPKPTDGAGPYTVRFTAANALSATATTSLRIDRKPVVVVPATVSVGETSVLTVNVTASDPDGSAITSLSADLSALPPGNNAAFVVNASKTAGTLTWTPSYNDGRAAPYAVTFTAANALSGTAGTAITVVNVDRAPVVSAPASATASPSTLFTLNVTAADPDGDAIASLTADLTGLPAGNDAVFTPNASRTAGTLAWTPKPTDGAGPYTVRFTAANALSATATTSLDIDLRPVVSAPATATVGETSVLTVNVTASDPDGETIASLTADLSALPPGNNAAFTVNASRTAGTLTWTPSASDARGTLYVITFTAANALSGTATTSVTVNNVDRAPAVTSTPVFAGVEGVRALISVTALDPDGDGVTSLTADLSGLPASSDAVFTVNASKTIGTLTWTPTYTHGRAAPYAVTFRAANALSRTSVSSITVRDVPPPGTELVANSGFESDVQGWTEVGRATLTRATSGRSGSWSGQLAATTGNKSAFSISDAPSAVDFVPTAGSTYRINAWVRSSSDNGTVRSEVAEMNGGSQLGATALSGGVVLRSSWAPVSFDYVARAAGSSLDVEITNVPVSGHEIFQVDDVSIKQIGNGPADRPPVVTAFAGALVAEGGTLTMSVLASDPDGHPLTSLVADFSALPAGHNAVFTTNAAKTLGTLTWTPTRFDSRGTPYVVMITAANTLSGSAAVAITVQDVAGEPGAPGTISGVVLVPDMAGMSRDIAPGVDAAGGASAGGAEKSASEHAAESDLPAEAPGLDAGASVAPGRPGLPEASGANFSARVVTRGGAIDLEFTARSAGRVKVRVFDIEGRRVGRPFDEFLPAGGHRVTLREPGKTAQMGSGVYFYRIEAQGIRRSGRFAVVR